MSQARKLWILNRGRIGRVVLGPSVRAIEMAKAGVAAGFEVHLCMDGCEGNLPTGIDFHVLGPELIRGIGREDRVVSTIFLDVPCLRALLRLEATLEIDFYCIGALENIATPSRLNPVRLFQGRRRTSRRYRWLLERADRILVSSHEQTAFLGGILFAQGTKRSCELASRLPEKVVRLPMGVSSAEFPSGSRNPYPVAIQGRRIFLWGGGIWEWFDMETLLQAFRILAERGSDACLFFLSGGNPSGVQSQNLSGPRAVSRASELGLLGNNVFFLDGGVSPGELPGYLEHCTAGVMSNPESMESLGSWRTRYLDLLWAGKGLVVSGSDPLAGMMARDGAARCVEAGVPEELAEALDGFQACGGTRSSTLRESLSWNALLDPWIGSEPERSGANAPVGPWEWIRYVLGT